MEGDRLGHRRLHELEARRRMLRVSRSEREGMARRFAEERAALQSVDVIVAPARFVREIHQAWADVEVVVVRGGAEVATLEALVPVPAQLPLRFAYFGRMAPEKGVDVLLRAFQGLSPEEVRLDLHGPLGGDARYQQLLSELTDDRLVRTLGPYSPAELPQRLAACDAVVVPSVCLETGPLVLFEALAAGRKVFATGAGGMRETIETDEQGWTYAAGDWRALRELVQAAIAAPTTLIGARPPTLRDADFVDAMRAVYEHVLLERAR